LANPSKINASFNRMILSKYKNRICMTCKNEFRSLGPHNRMCDKCRTRQSADPVYTTYR